MTYDDRPRPEESRLRGDDSALLLEDSIAGLLARTVAAPAEIPVGLLTSLLGAPWFLWLVFRRENSRHG